LLRHRYWTEPVGAAAAVMTCHNLAYHGWVPRWQVAGQLDLPEWIGTEYGVSLLADGILNSDMVNTVSPGFARESLVDGLGSGMEGVLRYIGDRYEGIINGLDTELWDPATDTALAANFSADNLAGKAACRAALCAETGLDPDGPILGMVSRLDTQKGFDLVADAVPALVASGARLCILGTGDHSLLAGLRYMAGRRPDRICVLDRFDRALSRRIYAGADVFLMPSRFEPCGQSQMIAMRYGTVPVVRATGGLLDTVIDADDDAERGNGFMFGPTNGWALAEACWRAMAALEDRSRWSTIQQHGMAVDWKWDGPAQEYVNLYRRAIAIHSGG
jgi:starch synthase